MLNLYPDELLVHLTDRCNLNCSYCFIQKKYKQSPSDVILKKAITLFLNLPTRRKSVSFLGGEPFLDLEKIEKSHAHIFSQGKNYDTKVAIVTNGTLIDAEAIQFLERARPELGVSIDGTRKNHDRGRVCPAGGSSYAKILSGLGRLRSHQIFPGANLIFTPANYERLLENIRHVRHLGFTRIDFYPDLTALWTKEDLLKLEKVFDRFAAQYTNLFLQKKENIFTNSFLKSLFFKKKNYASLFCRKIQLYGNGDFYVCDKVLSLPLKKRRPFIVGNVKKGLDNRLRCSLLEKIRSRVDTASGGKCRTCRFLKYCFCPIGNYIYITSRNMDFSEYFPVFCALSQIYLNSFFRILVNLRKNALFKKTYARVR